MKYIHNIHHYLGTFFFGMFLVWFLSGFVMMYKSFPFLSEKERIESNEVIKPHYNLPHPTSVFADHKNESFNSLRINRILGKPIYHLISAGGTFLSRFAYSNETLKINKTSALQIAKTFTGLSANADVLVLNKVDQWMPTPKYANHLPVYKVRFSDPSRSFVHVSSKTGEVLSNTSRSDRVWAWLGAIPHWMYLKEIRMHKTLWSQLCIWLSAFGFVMSLSGIITGIVRYRKKPKAGFKRFKNKWYNVHYYTGLAFGLFICTWIFSGFMSMSPFNWSYDFSLSEKESATWEGRTTSLNTITTKEWTTLQESLLSGSTKEIHFSAFSGKLFSSLFHSEAKETICLSDTNFSLDENEVSAQVNQVNKDDAVLKVSLMNQYDNYYYDKHNIKALPVFKAETQNQLVYYILPSNGKMLLKSDYTNRLERWLYHGLHSLDFRFLTNNRPLWDIVMITLLLGGTAVCITATWMGIKFVSRKKRVYHKRKSR